MNWSPQTDSKVKVHGYIPNHCCVHVLLLGMSCCTFIPVNDDNGHAIQSGIPIMEALARAMQADVITDK